MHPAQHSQNRPDPRPQARNEPAAMTRPAPGSADLIHRRHLEKTVSGTGRERLRCL
jgi:hypothetical protein